MRQAIAEQVAWGVESGDCFSLYHSGDRAEGMKTFFKTFR